MNLPALVILVWAAGVIVGVIVTQVLWLTPLRCERFKLRRLLRRLRLKRRRRWLSRWYARFYTADGYRRRDRVDRLFGRRERDWERN